MGATAEEARRELARRELARRAATRQDVVMPNVLDASSLPPGMRGFTKSDDAIPGGGLGGFLGAIGGLGETALQIGSGAIATPIAGLAGIGSLLPGGMSGADRVAQVLRL